MQTQPLPLPEVSKRDWLFLAALALLKIFIHLPFLGRYGFHHDELYFIACGDHLSFGYVDHAPLVPWIARLSTTLFGDSLFGLRILALLSGAAAVFMVGLLTRRLGGGRFAQITAAAAMMIAPVFLRTANMLCLPAFEPLFWVTATYLVVRIIQEDNPRLWLWVGVVIGAGLLNKHTMLFFAFGLVVGLVFTPQRKHFKSLWLYAGGAISLAFLLPNLIWQIQNDWPTLGFILNLKEGVMSGISLLQFLAGQLLYIHPFNALIWISGLVFLFSRAGKPFRILGWIWLAVFVLLVVTKSKIYYLAPAYVVLIATGGIAAERWVARRNKKWWRPAFISFLVIGGMLLGPISVPMLDIDTTETYVHAVTFGAFKNIYELTADLRGMFGWQERLRAVAEVYHSLSTEEKERAVIWASWYGNAGAVDLFGGEYGLPKSASLAMTYWLWGLPEKPIDIVIGMGFRPKQLAQAFHRVELAAEVELKNVNPWQTPFPVVVCRDPVKPLPEIWRKNRPW